MKIQDLVRFKKELYFDGAVQIDWAYDKVKQDKIASSFVFHGPKYFGVTSDDIVFKNHKLVDTASFTKIVCDKLSDDNSGSPFILSIAPYGTGKSHLAVTMASLFSGKSKTADTVIKNLTTIDAEIGQSITSCNQKPNLVLVLNGMKDFNLNYEILNVTQKALALHEIDTSFLKSLTRSYDIATQFVANNFEKFSEEFYRAANIYNLKHLELKKYLINHILSDSNAYDIIDQVYTNVTGSHIRWDEGVSAGDILMKLADTLCGERGNFNKILLLFDEFGRYIEFAGTYPTRASDAALQQIYEAVQNAENKIVFVGFIQSDLKTYLTRVDRTSNINRYVGRYEASDKVHLSSNLETIFASLLERIDGPSFENLVVKKLKSKEIQAQWRNFHADLLGWLPQAQQSGVWKDWERFSKVILEGTFPLHPLTTWILSNLSSWLQQRSSLTFLETHLKKYGEQEVHEFGDLPLVPATSIVLTDFFQELLSAEHDGRQQSEYCILYNQILVKQGDKLNSIIRNVLAGNLVIRIARLRTKTRDDVYRAISYATSYGIDEVKAAVYILESEFGVITFDEVAGCFDFVADATGINDFKRLLASKKRKADLNFNVLLNGRINSLIGVNNHIETTFDKQNYIKTLEWQFSQELIPIDDLTEEYLKYLIKDFESSNTSDKAKGKLLWLYSDSLLDDETVERAKKLLLRNHCDKRPFVFAVLEDKEFKFKEALVDLSFSFTEEEQIKFSRFIPEYIRKTEALIIDSFNELLSERLVLTSNGLSKMGKRVSLYCEELFKIIYPMVVSFPFEGFSNKTVSAARKNLSIIAKIIINKADYQWIHSQSTEVKNRLEAVLTEGRPGSWGMLNASYQLTVPLNPRIREVFSGLDELINEEEITVKTIFDKYYKPPFGMNDYSIALLLACFFSHRSMELKLMIGEERFRLVEWGHKVFLDKSVDWGELFLTKVSKVNADQLSSKYLSLFHKVERNNDVDQCPILYHELKKLQTEQDEPQEMVDKIINITFILDEGQKLFEKTKLFFGEQQGKLQKAKEEMEFRIAFDILDKCVGREGYIEGSSRYTYNDNQLNLLTKLITGSKNLIESQFENWLTKSVRCESVNGVSAFENWLNLIIVSFKKFGYVEYARKTKSKLEIITDDLENIRKLQNLKDECSRFLQTHVPDNKTNYDQLISWKAQGLNILDFIRGERVSEKDRQAYETSIEARINLIEGFIVEVRSRVSEIYDECYQVTDLSGCKNLLKKISDVLLRALHELDRSGLLQLADQIQNCLNDIENLKPYFLHRKHLVQELDVLSDKFESIESDIDFIQVLKSVREDMINYIEEMQRTWNERFIFTQEDISGLTESDCIKWLNQTKELPDYLSETIIESYYQCKQMINNRLNNFAVDAVLSLFENLSKVQQRKCFNILASRISEEELESEKAI